MKLAAIASLLLLSASFCRAETVRVEGTVWTWDGKPAVRAEVALVGVHLYINNVSLLSSTQTDAGGHFSFNDVNVPKPGAAGDAGVSALNVVCRLLGYGLNWTTDKLSENVPLKIVLPRQGTLGGKVTDTAGNPVANAAVRIENLTRSESDLNFRWDSCYLPKDLGTKWAQRTDLKGRYVLRDAGPGDQPEVRISASGYNEKAAYWRRDQDDIPTIVLYRESHISGTIQAAGPHPDWAHLKVAGQLQEGSAERWWRDVAPVDAAGKFVLTDVPPGTFHLSLVCDPGSEWQPSGGQDVTLTEGKSVENDIIQASSDRGTRVTGQVVDAATNAPLPGVTIYASGGSFADDREAAQTDANGRYSFYTRPGDLQLRVMSTKGNYIIPEYPDGIHAVSVADAPRTAAVFRLTKAASISVVVLDADGNPVEGAVVENRSDRFHFAAVATTDIHGSTALYGVDPDKSVILVARTATAFSEPVMVNPGPQVGPIRLVVKAGTGVSVRGKIVDEAGHPVARAAVMVLTHQGDSTRYSTPLRTDAQGMFQSRTLRPDSAYSLNVTAEGYEGTTVARWQALPGQQHDFGSVVLPSLSRFMAGKVVDSAGKPIPTARVWNGGHTVKSVEATTDSAGKFKLAGLPGGMCYLFAEKDGYELGGLQRPAPADGLTVTLYRSEELQAAPTVTKTPDASAFHSFGLEQIEKGLAEKDDRYRPNLVVLLYRSDPARAEAIAQKEGGDTQETLMAAIAQKTLSHSPGEALAYYKQIPDVEQRTWRLLEAAKSVVKTTPESARIVVASALEAARALPAGSHQTIALAECGRLMQTLGMPGATDLLQQAAVQAQKFPLTGWDAYARGAVAEQICDEDMPGALALIRPIGDAAERERHLSNIAYHIANTDLAGAKKILAEIPVTRPGQPMVRDSLAVNLCYRLALTQPHEAESIAQSIQDLEPRARAYLWMARLTATVNKQRAFGYLDDAVNAVLPGPGKTAEQVHNGRGSLVIAGISRAAAAMGDPEAHWMALRAVALLYMPEEPGMVDMRDRTNYADGVVAMALARFEPALSRNLLEDLIPRLIKTQMRDQVYYPEVGVTALAALQIDPAYCQQFLQQFEAAHGAFDQKSLLSRATLADYALADSPRQEQIVFHMLDIFEPEDYR